MKKMRKTIVVEEPGTGGGFCSVLESQLGNWGVGMEFVPSALNAKRRMTFNRDVSCLMFVHGGEEAQGQAIQIKQKFKMVSVLFFTDRNDLLSAPDGGRWEQKDGVWIIDQANPKWDMVRRIVTNRW